jgi:hypothetical protein
MTEIDKHVQALRDLLVAENEEYIARIEQRAAAARARGDLVNERMHLEDLARLRATPYPWDKRPEATVTSAITRAVMDMQTHAEVLRGLIVADHERMIAEERAMADRAAERGDLEWQRWHLESVARLRAIPYPWEKRQAS